MSEPKLTIELVPKTAWWSNVRSNVTRAEWEVCKQYVRRRSLGFCEICGGQGPRHPVECHEIWEYDDDKHIQTLVDLIALCPPCHQAKHYGRSEVVMEPWQLAKLNAHIMKVNGWRQWSTLEDYRDLTFKIWWLRSQHDWELDISFLGLLGIKAEVEDRS